MNEKHIERDFCVAAEQLGFIAIKMNLMGFRGLPDRLILGPRRFVLFIEFKRKNHTPRRLQTHFVNIIKSFGFEVLIIDGKDQTDELKKRLKNYMDST